MADDAVSLKEARKREPLHRMHAQDTWDSHDIHAIKNTPWVRPTSLEAPPPRPGFVQRWIRVAVFGIEDPSNAMRKFREGWKPRPASTIPPDFPVPTISHGQWAGCIGVEGMILCEMPKALADKRNNYYMNKTRNIEDAIERELQKESHPKMPIIQNRKSQSQLVKVPKAADDE